MFSTFATEHGTLIIRAVDIRRIEDTVEQRCLLVWEECGEQHLATIQGTARENLDRLIAEDLAVQDRVQRAQQRQSNGLPALSVPRGRR